MSPAELERYALQALQRRGIAAARQAHEELDAYVRSHPHDAAARDALQRVGRALRTGVVDDGAA